MIFVPAEQKSATVSTRDRRSNVERTVMGGAVFEDHFEILFIEAFHVANRVLANRSEAEDVAAETMARALDRWRFVARMGLPTGWVVRVAGNLAIDTVRRRRFVVGHMGDEAAPQGEDVDSRLALCEFIKHLPKRQREVLMLRYLADLPEVEIASLLGISPGSVKQHAKRALERLRRHDKEGVTGIAVSELAG